MISKTRPGLYCAPALIAGFVFLAFLAIIPDTFPQTPKPTRVAVLVSSSSKPDSALTSGRAPTPTAAPGPSLAQATEIERRAFEMTNLAREKNGLPPLTWASELCQMARIHSEMMVRLGFFSHDTPGGLHLRERAHLAGIAHFRVLGENIAYNQGFDDPGGFAVERWMLSSGHRANILNDQFQQSAIGVFVAPDGTVYFTQEFVAH